MRSLRSRLVLPLILCSLAPAALGQTTPPPTALCPVVCEKDPIAYSLGSPTTGTLILVYNWSTSGIGNALCHTCVPCKAEAFFVWTPGPGESAYYSRDGGNSWAWFNGPVGPVNVPMTSFCADPQPDTIDVIATGPNGTFEIHLILECYCI
jgi:hypothetical protein